MKIWITIPEASQLCEMPERTLRDRAIKGKLSVRKDNGVWLVDLDFLQNSGLVSNNQTKFLKEILKKYNLASENKSSLNQDQNRELLIKANLEKSKALQEKNKSDKNLKSNGSKKTDSKVEKGFKYNPLQLNIYKNLLHFYKSEKISQIASETKWCILDALTYLAVGYNEYHIKNKTESYRLARQSLLKGYVHLQVLNQSDDQILDEIASFSSGVAGLIRRLEKYNEKQQLEKTEKFESVGSSL